MKKAPRQIAEDIVAALRRYPETDALVSSIEIAGPGFINMRVADGARQDIVRQVLREGEAFGRNDAHKGESVLLEFVSREPDRAPSTSGTPQGGARQHPRHAGWAVTREFYYNDAGVQIGNLAESVKIRCRQLQGEAVDLPESAYHGEYIISIARDF